MRERHIIALNVCGLILCFVLSEYYPMVAVLLGFILGLLISAAREASE